MIECVGALVWGPGVAPPCGLPIAAPPAMLTSTRVTRCLFVRSGWRPADARYGDCIPVPTRHVRVHERDHAPHTTPERAALHAAGQVRAPCKQVVGRAFSFTLTARGCCVCVLGLDPSLDVVAVVLRGGRNGSAALLIEVFASSPSRLCFTGVGSH